MRTRMCRIWIEWIRTVAQRLGGDVCEIRCEGGAAAAAGVVRSEPQVSPSR